MIVRWVLLTILSVVAATASGQAPVPVVERTVTQGEVATRVSLFSNRVLVVTVRRGDEQDFMRRITLPDNEYMVYLGSFQTAAKELDQQPISSEVNTSQAEVVITLHIGPDAPRLIRFSPMSIVKLPLGRIQGALDDLQLRVLEASPSAEAMRTWEPAKGDCVTRSSSASWKTSCENHSWRVAITAAAGSRKEQGSATDTRLDA